MMAPAVLHPETVECTDMGGRDEQQDRAAVFCGNGVHLLVVADGLGGHEGGGLAAQAVVDAAKRRFAEVRGPLGTLQDTESHLAAIIAEAHSSINKIGSGAGSESPHSTCVLLWISEGVATWAHVGDSRLYRFEDGRIAERTFDHSVVEMLRLRGRITEEEMKTHPDQNRLYEALGGTRTPKPTFGSRVLNGADGFLLASDGVWEHVSNAQLEGVLCAHDFEAALKELMVGAKLAGGQTCDNLAAAGWRWAMPAEDCQVWSPRPGSAV